jgi:hypothetical protein
LRSRRLSIGQSLADRATDRLGCPVCIIDAERDPLVVAEIELGEISFQVFCADVMIGTADAALEDREVALDDVSVYVAPDLFFD